MYRVRRRDKIIHVGGVEPFVDPIIIIIITTTTLSFAPLPLASLHLPRFLTSPRHPALESLMHLEDSVKSIEEVTEGLRPPLLCFCSTLCLVVASRALGGCTDAYQFSTFTREASVVYHLLTFLTSRYPSTTTHARKAIHSRNSPSHSSSSFGLLLIAGGTHARFRLAVAQAGDVVECLEYTTVPQSFDDGVARGYSG